MTMTRPLSALHNFLNKPVIIICKNGKVCTGKMVEVDEYLNIVLEDYQERENGPLEKGLLFVRGTNISIIRLEES